MSLLAKHRDVIRAMLPFLVHDGGCKTHHRIGCTCRIASVTAAAHRLLSNTNPVRPKAAKRRAKKQALLTNAGKDVEAYDPRLFGVGEYVIIDAP